MSVIADFFIFFKINVMHVFSSQSLLRTPEPDQVTTGAKAVDDYDRVYKSALVIPYAISLQLLQILFKEKIKIQILDLACGPGLFTSWMAKYLSAGSVTGFDLSDSMLEKAKARFQKTNNSIESQFIKKDITNLSGVANQSMDLVTFMNASHHLPDISDVRNVLSEASRVCKTDGIIFLTDHTRPRSKKILDIYYNWISKKNDKFGLAAHNLDFFNSLHAGWSRADFIKMIPENDKSRVWLHIYPSGYQYIRFIVGIPFSHREIIFREINAKDSLDLIPNELHSLWKLTIFMFKLGLKVKK